jgi:hypothetical protein
MAMVEDVSLEDLCLDFTIPGYDIELRVRPGVSVHVTVHVTNGQTSASRPSNSGDSR